MLNDVAYNKFSVSLEMDAYAQRLIQYIKQHITPESKVSLSVEKNLGEFSAVAFIRGLQFEAIIDDKASTFFEALDKIKSAFNRRIERLGHGVPVSI